MRSLGAAFAFRPGSGAGYPATRSTGVSEYYVSLLALYVLLVVARMQWMASPLSMAVATTLFLIMLHKVVRLASQLIGDGVQLIPVRQQPRQSYIRSCRKASDRIMAAALTITYSIKEQLARVRDEIEQITSTALLHYIIRYAGYMIPAHLDQ